MVLVFSDHLKILEDFTWDDLIVKIILIIATVNTLKLNQKARFNAIFSARQQFN